MKKPLFAVLLIALLSITLLAGCAGSAQTPTQPPTEPPATAASTELKRISAEEAEAIALNHAGVNVETVNRIRTEFDYDDGRPEYDIEFHADGWEYDYEIHAESGEILRSEAEPPEIIPTDPPVIVSTEPAATEASAAISARISEEEARDIALSHAGLTADQVSRLRVEFDYDDGVPEYEVDFDFDSFEYDYEIHAETGKILSWDKDRID